MTTKRVGKDVGLLWLLGVTTRTYAVIPEDQILLDPHQPRKYFDPAALHVLAQSIKHEGLQQPIIVNPAFREGKKAYFYIDKGERRWRTCKINKTTCIECLVEPKVYDGTFNIDRKLKQASENACREPQTHGEIITLVAETVEATIAEYGARGAIGIACKRVALAFGMDISWAEKYHRLAKLHPDLIAMLDVEDEKGRLGILDAGKLVVAPLAEQKSILEKALALKEKGGYAAVRKYISEAARSIRAANGEKVRGRQPSDDKDDLYRFIGILSRASNNFIGERHSGEYSAYLDQIIGSLDVPSVESLLGQIGPAEVAIRQILETLRARREALYEWLKDTRQPQGRLKSVART